VSHCQQSKADVPLNQPEPGPGVVDGQQHAPGGAAHPDGNLPLWAGRADRVAQQIGNCAAKLDPIPGHAHFATIPLQSEVTGIGNHLALNHVAGKTDEIGEFTIRGAGRGWLDEMPEHVTEPLRLVHDLIQAAPYT
jgi:hypothetical protein